MTYDTTKAVQEFDKKFSFPPEIGSVTAGTDYVPKRKPTIDRFDEVRAFLTSSLLQAYEAGAKEEREHFTHLIEDTEPEFADTDEYDAWSLGVSACKSRLIEAVKGKEIWEK